MKIIECTSDQEISDTFKIMRQLRPHLDEENYLPLVRKIQKEGGRLIAAIENQICLGCALFRQETRLHTGPVIYIDDLITDQHTRSKGVGAQLIAWIEAEAKKLSVHICTLDSGVQRDQAHKFYFREGYTITSFNFKKTVR